MTQRGAILVIFGLVAALGLSVFFWGDGGAQRVRDDGVYVLYLAMAGVMVAAGVFHRGARRPGRMVRELLIWAGIIAAFAVGFAQWQERHARPPSGVDASIEAAHVQTETHSGSAMIHKAADGHFWTDARVNGRKTRFMVDTGASYVALPMSEAKKLGVNPSRDDFTARVQTANGPASAAPVILRDIRIAGVTVRNVEAVVLSDGLDTPLLGMSFLNRLESFEAKSDALRLKS